MDNSPPKIGQRFIAGAIAVAAVVGLLFFLQARVLPEPKTIETLNAEIKRLKAAHVKLADTVQKLDTRLSSLEKEAALGSVE